MSARPDYRLEDAILIDAIEVPCALGVTAEERAERRSVRIDLALASQVYGMVSYNLQRL